MTLLSFYRKEKQLINKMINSIKSSLEELAERLVCTFESPRFYFGLSLLTPRRFRKKVVMVIWPGNGQMWFVYFKNPC